MIDVESLTRFYGSVPAVQDVSFAIEERQIVGLLGHNGAGKTTVMKMLSGYLEPSSGSVRIGNRDLGENTREIQATLGYLPEDLPVYPELSVAEYLDYAAHLKGLRRADKHSAVRRSIDATGLGSRFFDPIGQLSRGFKQRVGVAQAILGSPEILILDEPGNGLDPEQNDLMRALIRELAQSATVILSTHIMQEVDALCDRVLVLAGGELVMDSPMEVLRESRRLQVECSDDVESLDKVLGRMPQIAALERHSADEGRIRLTLELHEGTALDTAAGNISRAVIESGARLFHLSREQQNLEDIFRDATQRRGGTDEQ